MIGIATGFAEHERQTPAEAVDEVERAVELGVAHLSAYQLTVESRTRFGELDRAGRLPLVGDDLMAVTFLSVSDALERRGFEHYEISNFARPGERSRHNIGYWRGQDYLGLGCAAYGTLSDGRRAIRYRNAPNPEKYLANARARDFSHHEHEELDGETRLRERIMLGLRLREGIDIDRESAELEVDPWPRHRARAADELCSRGRLAREGSRLFVPRNAWLFTDGTAAALF
jgi:oxygen-independent coproporphyrinogen-3 oxidase